MRRLIWRYRPARGRTARCRSRLALSKWTCPRSLRSQPQEAAAPRIADEPSERDAEVTGGAEVTADCCIGAQAQAVGTAEAALRRGGGEL